MVTVFLHAWTNNCPPELQVNFLSSHAGKQRIVEFARDSPPVDLSSFLHRTPNARPTISSLVGGTAFLEPNLLICFSPFLILHDYPPWELSNAEIMYAISLPHHTSTQPLAP